jgi:repressor LexA
MRAVAHSLRKGAGRDQFEAGIQTPRLVSGTVAPKSLELSKPLVPYPFLTGSAQVSTSGRMSTNLTEAQEAILAFMVRHQNEMSRPPSLREIADEFKFASSNGARTHVLALARKGYVIDTGDGRSWAAKVQEHLFSIPVYGTIPAGLPADNAQQADETIRIDPKAYRLRSAKGLFALHVRGDSMIDAQIADGDIALLRQDEPRPGQIVAALIDGASTLKRMVREGRRTLLRAENKRYRDLIPVESLTVQGVFVGLIGRGKR